MIFAQYKAAIPVVVVMIGLALALGEPAADREDQAPVAPHRPAADPVSANAAVPRQHPQPTAAPHGVADAAWDEPRDGLIAEEPPAQGADNSGYAAARTPPMAAPIPAPMAAQARPAGVPLPPHMVPPGR